MVKVARSFSLSPETVLKMEEMRRWLSPSQFVNTVLTAVLVNQEYVDAICGFDKTLNLYKENAPAQTS